MHSRSPVAFSLKHQCMRHFNMALQRTEKVLVTCKESVAAPLFVKICVDPVTSFYCFYVELSLGFRSVPEKGVPRKLHFIFSLKIYFQ